MGLRTLTRPLLRSVLALVFYFLTATLIGTLLDMSFPLATKEILFPVLTGFAVGLGIFTFLTTLRPLYVFGHELTHWVAAKITFRKTGKFAVRGTKGAVEVENPNIFVTLAPYCVPFYTIVWTGICGIILFFSGGLPLWLNMSLIGFGGITYAYHVRLTLYALRGNQSDIKQNGTILSLSIILFFNIFFAFIALIAATHQWIPGAETFLRIFVLQTKLIFNTITDFVQWMTENMG